MAKKIRGIVAKKTGKGAVIMTREGDFVRVPARSTYFPGQEVEVSVPGPISFSIVLSACLAVVLFFAVSLYMMRPAATAPEAYVALDANISILFSLGKDAVIIEAKPLNEEGVLVLHDVKAEGADILELLDALLEAAFAHSYLSPGIDNIIILSLAAPANYRFSEEDLRVFITNKLYQLKVDSYLKINGTDLAKVKSAKAMAIPLNALLLGEEMRSRSREADSRLLLEGSPPLPVREFLQKVVPAEIFSPDEFIHGDDSKPGIIPDKPPQAREDPEEEEEEEEEDDGPPITLPPRGGS
jgi:hypothetical protein